MFPFLSMLLSAGKNFFQLQFHQGPEESEEPESNPLTEQAETKSSEVGRVMTEEEYEEWRKEKEGGRQSEEDTGIDWGMGEKQFMCLRENVPKDRMKSQKMWHMLEKFPSSFAQ